jgi:hypothetical protein
MFEDFELAQENDDLLVWEAMANEDSEEEGMTDEDLPF